MSRKVRKATHGNLTVPPVWERMFRNADLPLPPPVEPRLPAWPWPTARSVAMGAHDAAVAHSVQAARQIIVDSIPDQLRGQNELGGIIDSVGFFQKED